MKAEGIRFGLNEFGCSRTSDGAISEWIEACDEMNGYDLRRPEEGPQCKKSWWGVFQEIGCSAGMLLLDNFIWSDGVMQRMEKIWRYNKDEGSRCGGEAIIRMLYKDFFFSWKFWKEGVTMWCKNAKSPAMKWVMASREGLELCGTWKAVLWLQARRWNWKHKPLIGTRSDVS